MLNKPQPAQTNLAVQADPSSPPVPSDYGSTVSLLGLLISLAALFVSLRTNSSNAKRDKSSRFEADHGTALRLAFRELQAKVSELRALSFPSAKTLDDLKAEIPGFLAEIDSNAYAVVRLVAEIDQSNGNSCIGWTDEMIGVFDDCLVRLERLNSAAIVDLTDFRAKVAQAQSRYDVALSNARQKLESVRQAL